MKHILINVTAISCAVILVLILTGCDSSDPLDPQVEEQINELQGLVADLEQAVASLKQEDAAAKISLEQAIGDLQINELQGLVADLEQAIANLEQEDIAAKISLEQAIGDLKIDELQGLVTELEQAVANLEQEDAVTKINLEQAIGDLEQEISAINNQIAILKQEADDVEEPDLPDQPATQIASWEGSGVKATEPFTITKSPWFIAWAHTPDEWGMLSIWVHTTNGDIVTLAVSTTEEGSDTSYVYETGTFYLDISSANTTWAIEVYQAQ